MEEQLLLIEFVNMHIGRKLATLTFNYNLWPIPQPVIDTNKDVILEQNWVGKIDELQEFVLYVQTRSTLLRYRQRLNQRI